MGYVTEGGFWHEGAKPAEMSKQAPQPRTAIPARPDPTGVKILDGHRRVGDDHRHTYQEHVSDLFAHGYLSQEEFDGRQAAIAKAETEYDLLRIVADLPGFVQPARDSLRRAVKSPVRLAAFVQANANETWFRWIMHVTLALIGVAVAIMPAALTAGFSGHASALVVGVSILGIICGVILIIVSLVAGIIWADNN